MSRGSDDSGCVVRLTRTAVGLAEIELANEPLNLVTKEMINALNLLLRELSHSDDVRCVILHGGASRAFCAGSDMNEFADLRSDALERKILPEDAMLRRLARLPMPTIAAIDGPALGGGLELALACDLRVAGAGIKMGLTESRIGGLAANGAVRLTRLVGPSRAKQLLFTGETISAETAFDWGMINRLAMDCSALEVSRQLAAAIASRGPISNRLAKGLVDIALDETLDDALSRSTLAQREIFDSADLHRGTAAFFGKYEPKFQGD